MTRLGHLKKKFISSLVNNFQKNRGENIVVVTMVTDSHIQIDGMGNEETLYCKIS